jgi:hypothetical protein
MTTKTHDPTRYRVTLSTGRTYTYAPRAGADSFPWRNVMGQQSSSGICFTPADYRACAEVVERWEADHAPRMRRRLLYVDLYYWARHETLGGFVYGVTESEARNCAKHQDFCDTIKATDANLAMLADLAARPNEEATP